MAGCHAAGTHRLSLPMALDCSAWHDGLWLQVFGQGAKVLLRGCLLEGAWAADTHPAVSEASSGQILVDAAEHAVAVLDRCTLQWQDQGAAQPAPTLPFAAHQGAQAGAQGGEDRSILVALIKAERQGRAQVSRCELRAVDVDPRSRFFIMGLHASRDGVVSASRCRLDNCLMSASTGSSVTGSQLALRASSAGSGSSSSGFHRSALCGVALEPGSACKLSHCYLEGFKDGVQASRGIREEELETMGAPACLAHARKLLGCPAVLLKKLGGDEGAPCRPCVKDV